MPSRIVITGASGTVGYSLVREFSRRGVPIRACVHTPGKADKMREVNTEVFVVDYFKKETLEAAFRGIEKLYLLTPFAPDQVEMAWAIVDSAKKAGIRHIVKLSGKGADIEPGITVGRLHREAERYIEASGIPYTFLRPNFFMQNFINFYGQTIRSEGRIYLPLGGGKVSYVDTKDIASVAAEVLVRGGYEGRALTLTGPEALSVNDVAQIFSKVLGKRILYVDVQEQDAVRAMRGLGMGEWHINALMELHGVCKAGYAADVTNTIEEITGKKATAFERFAGFNAKYILSGSTLGL